MPSAYWQLRKRDSEEVDAALPLDSLLAPGRALRPVGGGIVSALSRPDEGAPFDRRAAVYDRIIGGRAYNRLVWGASIADYERFAAEALAAGDGPFLDAGCGTLVFTAAAYRQASRQLVLVDLSLGMLRRAASRLAGAPASLVQADVLDLPFAPKRFATVACHAMLHVLDEPWAALAALRDQLAPGGRLFASMLVSDRAIGRPLLAALHRAGEVGRPRSTDELAGAACQLFGQSAEVQRRGSMAWVRAAAATERNVSQ